MTTTEYRPVEAATRAVGDLAVDAVEAASGEAASYLMPDEQSGQRAAPDSTQLASAPRLERSLYNPRPRPSTVRSTS